MSTDYHTRKYDLVLFGATGFTGELTAEYVVELKDDNLKWAIAGRNLNKLEQVRDRLSVHDPSLKKLDILIADSNEPTSLDQVLEQTRVVISTVGPFIKYGTPLVEACIRNGTHYVDITGEYAWIKKIMSLDDEAKSKNVMIVPTCGFDCIPSDLGVYMLARYMQDTHHLDLANVKCSLVSVVGGLSGGTIQSVTEAMCDSELSSQDQINPYLLATQRGVDKTTLPVLRKDHDFGNKWQAFYFMSVVNEKVVRRSWSIWADRGHSYGNLFSYKESMTLPFFPALLLTTFVYTVIPFVVLLLKIPFVSHHIKSWLPAAGSGPSAEKRAKGRFELQFVGEAETEPYDDPVRIKGIVKGFRDPGYGDTCRMVVESALCIVKSLDQLPGKQGGILTPATAFGDVLLQRLRHNQGMVFEVSDYGIINVK